MTNGSKPKRSGEDFKIIEIRKNEHFGDALMFLNEPCPLIAKVRSKTAELLILRKMEAIEIYSLYPNIWKRINKKSLFNMEQIYLKIKKRILEIAKKYGVNIDKIWNRRKNSKCEIKSVKFAEDKKEEDNQDNQYTIKVEEPKLETIREMEGDINNIQGEHKIIELHDFNERWNKRGSIHDLYDHKVTFSNLNGNKKESYISLQGKKKSRGRSSSIFIISNKSRKSSSILEDISLKNNKKKLKNTDIIPQKLLMQISSLNSFRFKEQSIITEKEYNNSRLNDKQNEYILTLSDKEKRYSSFSNLSTTKEKSFQLLSSYENINQMTDYKYLNNFILQTKIKDVIIRECRKNSKKQVNKNLFLQIPSCQISKSPKASGINNSNLFSSLLSGGLKNSRLEGSNFNKRSTINNWQRRQSIAAGNNGKRSSNQLSKIVKDNQSKQSFN